MNRFPLCYFFAGANQKKLMITFREAHDTQNEFIIQNKFETGM